MKREDIEKAAGNYSGSILGFRDNLLVMDKHKAFVDGAEWRIISVWHDANEEPKYDEYFLYENVVQAYHTDCIYPSEDEPFIWKVYAKDWGIVRWAYIKDLLPNKEY